MCLHRYCYRVDDVFAQLFSLRCLFASSLVLNNYTALAVTVSYIFGNILITSNLIQLSNPVYLCVNAAIFTELHYYYFSAH